MVEYNFRAEKGVLYALVTGRIEAEEMMQRTEMLGQRTDLPRDLKILEDAREAVAVFGVSDVKPMLRNIEKHLGNFDSVRHAVVHSNPMNTAFALIADQFRKDKKYRIRVFSTVEAAEKWLERDT